MRAVFVRFRLHKIFLLKAHTNYGIRFNNKSAMSMGRPIHLIGGRLATMMTKEIPSRVFLDTCVVNFMLDFGEQIHDGATSPPRIDDRQAADIDALRNLFLTGQRTMWQLALSPHTYFEITRTQDQKRRSVLDLWFQELWQYWRSTIDANDNLPTFIEAEDHRVRTLVS